MGLGHDHSHGDHAHSHGSSLGRALAVTLVFAVVEVVGGYWANSLALLSDAVHMLADGGALVVSLLVVWISRRPAGKGYTYGYQRVEILGALLNGLAVWLISGVLIFESIARFRSPEPVKGGILLGVAAIGLLANLISLFFLHRSAKDNLNVRSAYLHVLSDALGSVGAMIAGVVISLTGWLLVDPIITVLMALLMLYSSFRLLKESIEILMEKSPSHLPLEKIRHALEKIPGVEGSHDLHIWTLSSGSIAMSVHLIGRETSEILTAATELLEKEFSITHTTIQIESHSELLGDHCETCD
ncbi:MAG: cation transporter [Cryobacterium sp.]|nr:cation transporter [Oligoflexia bacterium]